MKAGLKSATLFKTIAPLARQVAVLQQRTSAKAPQKVPKRKKPGA